MTSILAAEGDQKHFKACLTLDPAYLTNLPQIRENKFEMKHPCFIL
jgi:hypothetical protein